MSKILIKKYKNKKYYIKGKKYINPEQMIYAFKKNANFKVIEYDTKEDITNQSLWRGLATYAIKNNLNAVKILSKIKEDL